MSFAVVALVLGLVLLVAAAGLFLRASPRDAGRPETAGRAQELRKGTASTAPDSAPDVEEVAGIAAPADASGEVESDGAVKGNAKNAEAATTGGADAIGHVVGALTEDDSSEGSARSPSPADVAASTSSVPPVPPAASAVSPGSTAPAGPVGTSPAEQMGLLASPGIVSTGNFSGRRGRRNWATAHGFEYTREDAFLTAEWPVSLVRELSPTDSGPVARDVVSGFLDGHQLHIADVAGSTVFALRRGAYSPVNVHISTSAAMPAGMRHDSALDRGTFTVYTTDPRAMARVLDIRLENALAGLTGAVRDVAFSGAWVTVRGARRIDADRWDAFLPYLLALDAASRVLPPMVTTAALDIEVADPTRPRPGSGVRITVPALAGGTVSAPGAKGKGAERAGSAEGTESSEGAESTGSLQDAEGGNAPKQPRPGYLRAVPDAPAKRTAEPGVGGASDHGSEGPSAGESDEGSTPGAAAGESASPQSVPGKHPPVERPTVPVDFPTRAQGKVLGEADLDGIWPEDVAEDGLTSIPALGEEPSPPPEPGLGDPRIVRTGDSATIFADAPGDEVSIGDVPEEAPEKKPKAAHVAQDSDDGDDGVVSHLPERHQGSDARYTGDPDDSSGNGDTEIVDAEVVDPEVVDPED